ncbi:FecR family protein [Novosphingobium terrae]|uniref:FecR family protein n=1 Tax=Novosphingobium terrae TaxID=2726189 RepID=UPI0019803ABD|nr:FecR family protein [Novosphingobium terrae]
MTDAPSPSRAIRRQAAQWLAQREAASWTPEAEARCAAWRAADPRHEQAYAQAQALWDSLDATVLTETIDPEAPLARHRFSPRNLNLWAAMAAALVLAVLGAPELAVRLRADAITAVGERRSVALPDGSMAMLNTDSAIAVDSANPRTIRLLRGEAAFSVAPDRAHPFTVLSGGGSTTALGTRFIVRQDHDNTQVTVTEHAVRITREAQTRVLHEGAQLTYGPHGIGPTQNVETDDADAWMRGHLRVVNMPLGAVVAQLNRYHRGYIGVSADLAQRPVSGVFDIDDPVGAVDVIERTLGLGSTRLTDHVILIHS